MYDKRKFELGNYLDLDGQKEEIDVLNKNNVSESINSENSVIRIENVQSFVIFFKFLQLVNKKVKLSFFVICNVFYNFWKRQELRYRGKERFLQ